MPSPEAEYVGDPLNVALAPAPAEPLSETANVKLLSLSVAAALRLVLSKEMLVWLVQSLVVSSDHNIAAVIQSDIVT